MHQHTKILSGFETCHHQATIQSAGRCCPSDLLELGETWPRSLQQLPLFPYEIGEHHTDQAVHEVGSLQQFIVQRFTAKSRRTIKNNSHLIRVLWVMHRTITQIPFDVCLVLVIVHFARVTYLQILHNNREILVLQDWILSNLRFK